MCFTHTNQLNGAGLAAGTVEDRILELQEQKRKLVSSAFGEDGSNGAAGTSRLSLDDLKFLFS